MAQVAPSSAWLGLHEVLFPLGERQRATLRPVSVEENPRVVLAALHAATFDEVIRRATAEGASAEIIGWLSLTDARPAAEYLVALPRRGYAARRVERAVAASGGSLIGDLYATVLPGDLRHRLGEHYTPLPLVRRVLSPIAGGTVLLDPACGDGRFLVAALQAWPRDGVAGCDVNPLAVSMARYEVWCAQDRPLTRPPTLVVWADFLLDGRATPRPDWAPGASDLLPVAHHFVGNPPWVLWRNLGRAYRAAVAEVFAETELNRARGWKARVSAGQTDLSYLFVHEALERVSPHGTVNFVLPRSVFKAPIGASVIRTGRTSGGRRFGYTEVLECSRSASFADVRTDAIVGRARADARQRYPVRWVRLSAGRADDLISQAYPTDLRDPSSSWVVALDGKRLVLRRGQTRATYTARGGINTGGGNGIFHVDVVESLSSGLVRIRNRPSRGFPNRVVEASVESAFIRPLLKGTDVEPWRTSPRQFIVLPYPDADPRQPLAERKLRELAPRTYEYLSQFRAELESRKELARWGGAWYSVFRIGPYTTQGWRVIWPTSGVARLRATVLPPHSRAVVDQKVVLVSIDEPEPAFFLAALLNSGPVRQAVASGSGLDASPSLLERLPLPAWDPGCDRHIAVAAAGQAAYERRSATTAGLDDLVASLFE